MEAKLLTTQEWLDYLQSKPEDEWITDYMHSTCNGKECYCAAGFINLRPEYPNIYDKAREFLPVIGDGSQGWDKDTQLDTIVNVNDSRHPKYQQDTPKQRVIQLLSDMIAAGY